MPTLNWIGKKVVVNHHRQVPFHLLKDVPGLSVGDTGTGNLIVEGDNLLALKALLPYYAGQVKCIYIDPPYNTGNENWIYNDNVNSPEIREWLGKVVGSETEDLTRHDKWLCMMYPRLSLLREMLREDGAIFISIDDNEHCHLKMIMDELFGEQNFVANFIRRRRKTQANLAKNIAPVHEYVSTYAKNIDLFQVNMLPLKEDYVKKMYKNPDNDPRGLYRLAPLLMPDNSSNKEYELAMPNGRKIKGKWKCSPETFKRYVRENLLAVTNDGQPNKKVFLEENKGYIPNTWLDDVASNEEASKEIEEIFGSNAAFSFPKPTGLIKRILQLATDKNSIILDSFAGSGTTAHAVLKLNKEDGGNRKFILVEIDSKICKEITTERVNLVSKGYKNSKGKKAEGIGGGFRYCQLGDPLFDEKGNIRNTVRFAELAKHVYFTETGEPLPKQSKANCPLLEIYNGLAVYLLYNGILKDKTPNGGNVLTTKTLSYLPKHEGSKVIYGTACRIGNAKLRQKNITFKQLPYKLRVAAL